MNHGAQGDAPPLATDLATYAGAINDFTESLLRPYLERINRRKMKRGSKEFNDAVWGTVTLLSHEVIVLDSPLIQRLRRIRQLGVVHFVYPGANHSRFEHSLGVCHQVSELAESINTHSDGRDLLSNEWVETLRLAGLCHDIGHGVMSHVIENALKDDTQCEDLLLKFQKSLKKAAKPQLSEMAAYYMMLSPAVGELLSTACDFSKTKKFSEDLPQQIAKIIVGKSVDDEFPLLHELISGPFDADKLDYMPRDAKMCGVPVVIDVVRLIQKLRATIVPSDQLPAELRSGVKNRNEGHIVLGVARSGASALDEVSLGRTLMFDKIYRHHKVRAVEAMIASVIQEIGQRIEPRLPLLPLALHDEGLLDFDLDKLRTNGQGRPVSDPDPALDTAGDILDRIRNRHLFARCFAFAQTMPFDAYKNDDDQRLANENFIRAMADEADKRAEFVGAVIDEVAAIAAIVGRESYLDAFPGGRLNAYIRVDAPTSSGRGSESDQSRAYLVDEAGKLSRVEKVRAENRGWSDAYVNAKDVGFIFAPAEIGEMVHIAAEVAARAIYRLRIPRQMQAYAKLGGEKVEELRRELADGGYFAGKPRDLAPEPEMFREVETSAKISLISDNLSRYMGPPNDGGPQFVSSAMNKSKILDWIGQYPEDCLEMALATVLGIRMLSRDDACAGLEAFHGANPAYQGAAVVPLGEPKDGSAVHTYHLGDVTKKIGYSLRTLESALLTGEPIVFADDLIGRGSSAISIFEAMLGETPTTSLNETRAEPLSADAVSRLRDRKIAVIFSTGFPEGKNALEARLEELGLTAVVHVNDFNIPTVEGVLSSGGFDKDKIQHFRTTSETIGRALLADGHSQEWAEGRAFGYGNTGSLVVTSYNAPTLTLTALWQSGIVDGVPWRALLPRRKKN